MNEINFSDDYFFSTNNIISLLFMWILWNESAGIFIPYLIVNENVTCSFLILVLYQGFC